MLLKRLYRVVVKGTLKDIDDWSDAFGLYYDDPDAMGTGEYFIYDCRTQNIIKCPTAGSAKQSFIDAIARWNCQFGEYASINIEKVRLDLDYIL